MTDETKPWLAEMPAHRPCIECGGQGWTEVLHVSEHGYEREQAQCPECGGTGDRDAELRDTQTELFRLRDELAKVRAERDAARSQVLRLDVDRDMWATAAESQNRQWARACERITEETAAKEQALARIAELEAFARECRDNWDCDVDAHAHGTRCRVCEAAKLVPSIKQKETT